MRAPHLLNSELIKIARQIMRDGVGPRVKMAFVPAGALQGGGMPPMDPAMTGGMPPMDPAMMGGMPPMDPAMMGGGMPPMDPAMMGGGMPPMDPTMMGGGMPPAPPPGGDPMQTLRPIIEQIVQQTMNASKGGAGAGGLKPKIDINAVLVQILKILARIADQLGIQIPASEMVVNQQDLTNLAGQSQNPGGGSQAIPPVGPMPGITPAGVPGGKTASYRGEGTAFDTTMLNDISNRAAAVSRLLNRARLS